jgi:hypothetical protein
MKQTFCIFCIVARYTQSPTARDQQHTTPEQICAAPGPAHHVHTTLNK